MKIVLKHGNQLYFTVCPYCHCEFLYDYMDTDFTENSDGTYSNKVQCPECSSFIQEKGKRYNNEITNIEI